MSADYMNLDIQCPGVLVVLRYDHEEFALFYISHFSPVQGNKLNIDFDVLDSLLLDFSLHEKFTSFVWISIAGAHDSG